MKALYNVGRLSIKSEQGERSILSSGFITIIYQIHYSLVHRLLHIQSPITINNT